METDFDMGDACGQALPIGMCEGSSQFPSTGEEYLARVVKESKSYPKVAVAELPASLMQKNKPDYVKTNEITMECKQFRLKPSVEWQQAQIAQLSKVREAFHKEKTRFVAPDPPTVPDSKDDDAWNKFITNNRPLNQYILPLDQPAIIDVLEYVSEMLSETEHYDHALGSWFYSLFVALEKPLDPDGHSVLRDIARRCLELRTQTQEESSELQGLNLLVCIIARYFDQLDLAD